MPFHLLYSLDLESRFSTNVRTALVGTTTFLLTKWLLSGNKAKHNRPPGPRGLPYLGNILSFFRNKAAHLTMAKWAEDYGEIYGLQMGPHNYLVLLNSKEAIREVLQTYGHQTSHRPVILANKLLGFHGKGIFNNHGQSLKEMRRTAVSSLREFGLGKKSLEEKMHEEVQCIITELDQVDNNPINLKMPLLKSSVNVICSIVLGSRFNREDPEFIYIVHYFMTIFAEGGIANIYMYFPEIMIVLPFIIPIFLHKIKQIKDFTNYIKGKIQEHRTTFDPNNLRDFIDLYLEAEGNDSDDGIHTESNLLVTINDVFIAGSETTATLLHWAFLYLILNPEVQDKCRQEILQVVGTSRLPTFRDRIDLPYIDATLHETLRRGNVAIGTLFHTTSEDVTYKGYTIPKDTMILGNFYPVHMDPKNFEDPEAFKPDRWLDQSGKVKSSDAFFPFSIGPRECPGKQLALQEAFIFLTSLLQQFRFSPVDPDNLPSTIGKLGITYRPTDYEVIATRV